MIHSFSIPAWRPATLNQLMRGSLRERMRLSKSDREIVWGYSRQQDVPKATGKRRVSLVITLVGKQQEADADAYQKTVLDSLVACGMLLGDKQADVEWGGVQYLRGSVPETVICLEDLR